MKITIITPTFNSASTIQDLVSSVHNQNWPEIEHIIVDGGSTDRTLELIMQSIKRPVQIISEKDLGIYDAINKGMERSTGDVLGILNSDDFYASMDVLEKVMSEFQSHNCDYVYADLDYIDKAVLHKIVRRWRPGEIHGNSLKLGWMPPHPTFFIKKELLKYVGKYNISYKISADYDFMLRILKNKNLKYSYIKEVIVKMRLGGASNRSIKNIFIKNIEDLRIINSHKIGNSVTLFLKSFLKLSQFWVR